MMKKLLCLLVCTVILFCGSINAAAETSKEGSKQSETIEKPELIGGNLVVVRSVETGQILFDTTKGQRISPTVSAKLVAAMVAYDMIKSLDENVKVSPEATLKKNIGEGGLANSVIQLSPNEQVTARQLMTATLVSAANDACYALAYYASDGDIEGFIAKMNEKAESLGCTDTVYHTCVGLTDGKSRTTVRDVSLIAAAFYKYNTLLSLSSQPTYMLGNTKHTKNYLLSKTLISTCYLEGVKGMIAGQAREDGGYCLITSAEKNGLGYVFVVMEGPSETRNKDGTRTFPENSAYDDVKKLYPWAVSSFKRVTLTAERARVGELSVTLGKSDYVSLVTANEIELLLPVDVAEESISTVDIFDAEGLEAPVQKDVVMGRRDFYYDGNVLASVELIVANDVPKDNTMATFESVKAFLKSGFMKRLVQTIIIILIAYTVFVIACKIYRIIINANRKAQKNAALKRRKQQKAEKEKENNE